MMQSGIQTNSAPDWINYLNDVYNSYLQNKLKAEQTYNQDTLSGKVRGLLEAFNNPVGYFIIILLIIFIYKKK